MATIANEFDPNNPNANANQGGGGTVMPSQGGGGASGGGGGSSPAPSNTPYTPPNVSQYLSANQGAGQQLTQGITKNVQSQANQLSNATNSAQNTANNQYGSLNSNLNTSNAQNVAQTAFQNPQALLDSYNAAKTQSSSQPLASDQYNQFQQLNNGGYNQGIQNYGNTASQAQGQLQGQLANLTQQTGAANNEMGRNQLLQGAVNQGNYNQGEQTLDSLFLQGQSGQHNANGLSNLQQLQQNLGGIGQNATQQVGAFGNDTQSKLAALQGMSAADQAGIKNLFQSGSWNNAAGNPAAPYDVNSAGLNQIAGNVGNEFTTGQANAANTQAELASAAQNGQKLTPSQLQQLGLTQGTKTWGINDITPYISNNALTGNAQTATPEEFARYQALNQLANGPTASGIFGSQAAPTGTYNPVNFDSSRFASDVLTRKQAVEGADFKNALQSALLNFGPAPSGGTSFGAPAQGGQATAGFINNMYQQLASGNLTPQQANDMINQETQAIQHLGSNAESNAQNAGFFTAAFNPYTQYYNNEYQPAAGSILGNPLASTGNPGPVAKGLKI